MPDLTDWDDLKGKSRYAIINASSGTNEIIPAETNKKYFIMSYVIQAEGDTTVQFTSDTGDTSENETGAMSIHCSPTVAVLQLARSANGGINVGFSPCGHFSTDTGKSLNLTVTGSDVNGHLTYFER
jgi:hypothetical protein